MIKSFIINKYLAKTFFKVVMNMSLGFLCLGFILNLFEEINFFKDFDVGIGVPILLSAIFVPSLLYKMFPFVILLSGIWFFLFNFLLAVFIDVAFSPTFCKALIPRAVTPPNAP